MRNFSPILLITFIAYTALSIFGMFAHELSLDEAHHWLLARDSTSISNLIHNARYDGHPILWDLILYFVACISRNAMAMQITNLLISVIATFLFLRNSPFTNLQKILITFSYYLFFEYSLISRGYSLTWLFFVIICQLFTKDYRNYLLVTILLVLMANTHLFSLICSIPLFIIILKEHYEEKSTVIPFTGLTLLYLIGISISIWTMIPPADSGFMSNTFSDLQFSFVRSLNALSFFIKGMFCLPNFTNYQFWNSNYFITHFPVVAYVLSFTAFFVPLFTFNKKETLFIFYFSSLAITVLFYILKLEVGAHYMGYCFMLFLACFWIDRVYRTEAKYRSPMLSDFILSIGNILLWCILSIQILSGLISFYHDIRYPFSEGKNAAAELRSQPNYKDMKIAVMPFNTGPPIAAYLNRKLYYPENYRAGTFCDWNTKLIHDQKEVAGKINELLNTMIDPTIALVLSYPPEEITYLENSLAFDPHPFYTFIDLRSFGNSISENGNYTILYFERVKLK